MARVKLVRYGGLLAVAGLSVSLFAMHSWVSLLGFAAVGAGFSTVVPQLFTASGRVPGVVPEAGVTAVTTMGYLGFLVGPPLIGFAAELMGLRAALGLVVFTSALLVVFARSVAPQTSTASAPPSGSPGAPLPGPAATPAPNPLET